MGVELTTFELEVQRASPLRHRGWHISIAIAWIIGNIGGLVCAPGGTLGIFGWRCFAGTLEPLHKPILELVQVNFATLY